MPISNDDYLIPNESELHSIYSKMERVRSEKIKYLEFIQNLPNPNPFLGRQAYYSNPSRFDKPSFRSIYFSFGDGLQTLSPGETKTLANITVPAFYSGVITGFSQDFGGCDTDIINQITWGIRINELPTQGLPDFVGEFSSLALPYTVYFPLIGGSTTLGNDMVNPGSIPSIDPTEATPTARLQATNNSSISVVLQGRLIGFTFPDAERDDEFANI